MSAPPASFEADGRNTVAGDGPVLDGAVLRARSSSPSSTRSGTCLSISVLEPQPTLEHYQRVVENGPVYARVLMRTASDRAARRPAVSRPVPCRSRSLMANSRWAQGHPAHRLHTSCRYGRSVLVRTGRLGDPAARETASINQSPAVHRHHREPIRLLYTQGRRRHRDDTRPDAVHGSADFYGALRNISEGLCACGFHLRRRARCAASGEVRLPVDHARHPSAASSSSSSRLWANFITPATAGSHPTEIGLIATLISPADAREPRTGRFCRGPGRRPHPDRDRHHAGLQQGLTASNA